MGFGGWIYFFFPSKTGAALVLPNQGTNIHYPTCIRRVPTTHTWFFFELIPTCTERTVFDRGFRRRHRNDYRGRQLNIRSGFFGLRFDICVAGPEDDHFATIGLEICEKEVAPKIAG